MKFKLCTIALALFFISCSNDKKVTEVARQVSALKTDILLQNSTQKPFSKPNSKDEVSLTIYGTTIVKGTAVFKVVNAKGKELHCESFPAKELIQDEYQTANSVLKDAHIRDVLRSYFGTTPNDIAQPDSADIGLLH